MCVDVAVWFLVLCKKKIFFFSLLFLLRQPLQCRILNVFQSFEITYKFKYVLPIFVLLLLFFFFSNIGIWTPTTIIHFICWSGCCVSWTVPYLYFCSSCCCSRIEIQSACSINEWWCCWYAGRMTMIACKTRKPEMDDVGSKCIVPVANRCAHHAKKNENFFLFNRRMWNGEEEIRLQNREKIAFYTFVAPGYIRRIQWKFCTFFSIVVGVLIKMRIENQLNGMFKRLFFGYNNKMPKMKWIIIRWFQTDHSVVNVYRNIFFLNKSKYRKKEAHLITFRRYIRHFFRFFPSLCVIIISINKCDWTLDEIWYITTMLSYFYNYIFIHAKGRF